MADKFWFVWAPTGRAPTHKHSTRRSAVNEAERLARMNPDTEFVVLESLATVQVRTVQWEEHEMGAHAFHVDSEDSDLPF